MDRGRKIYTAAIIICTLLFAVTLNHFVSMNGNDNDNIEVVSYKIDSSIYDIPYEYEFSPKQDLQLPELPTGCEATALSTLLRINGVDVTKFEVADAMPKSTSGEFVHHFWGDPYTEHNGWACMAPCSVETANMFLDENEKVAVEHTGMKLTHLPLPSAVWVTMYLEDPMYTDYESEGYRLFANPHCVVVEYVDDMRVCVIDPLVGRVEYPFSKFEEVYKALGSQAVCIENVDNG